MFTSTEFVSSSYDVKQLHFLIIVFLLVYKISQGGYASITTRLHIKTVNVDMPQGLQGCINYICFNDPTYLLYHYTQNKILHHLVLYVTC